MEMAEELTTEFGDKCLNNSSHNDHFRISPNKYKVSCRLNVSQLYLLSLVRHRATILDNQVNSLDMQKFSKLSCLSLFHPVFFVMIFMWILP